MNLPACNNEKGVALLITVSIMLILVTVTLEMNRKMRTDTRFAASAKNDLKMRCMAESGIQLGMSVLCRDAEESATDSVQEIWANPGKLASLVSNLGFDEASIDLHITDEMGKLQINSLLTKLPGRKVNMDQYPVWEAFFDEALSKRKAGAAEDTSKILNPVIDWMDSGDNETTTGLSGAESSFYRNLDHPYECPNREFTSVEEIYLVKGINDLFASKEGGKENFLPPLEKFITVYGAERTGRKHYRYPGRININTADEKVIAALLPFGKRDLARQVVEYRKEKTTEKGEYLNDLTVDGWYVEVAGLNGKEAKRISRIVTLSSDIFSIRCSVKLKGRIFRMETVVKREKEKNGEIVLSTLRQKALP